MGRRLVLSVVVVVVVVVVGRRRHRASRTFHGMASGCARRKRKRIAERTKAWTTNASDGSRANDDRESEGGEDAKARAAKARDVDALERATRDGLNRDHERSLVLATRIAIRVRKDSPFVAHVLATTTSDGERAFACAYDATWGEREMARVTRALGFELIEYEEIALSAAPDVKACVIRIEDVKTSGQDAKRRKSGTKAATTCARFLARAREMTDPIQAPSTSSASANEEDGAGLNAWVAAHRSRRPGTAEAVKASIDAWFEKKSAEDAERSEEAARAAKADDGWTMVQAKRGRRKTTEEATGTTVGGIRAATADGRRKGPKKIANEEFYRFQSKEKKRNEIIELQAKFELDKQRIIRLKASRKFKPS